MGVMDVLLHRVGRNLARVYRTCEAFGVERLLLHDCDTAYLAGNLHSAAGRVMVVETTTAPPEHSVILDPRGKCVLSRVDWKRAHCIVVGGETHGVPVTWRRAYEWCARIPLVGRSRELTVEAALAIALYEWRRP